LSKVEETLIVDGVRYELSANFYPGAVHPEGYRYLTDFRLDLFPRFRFEVGGVVLEKSVRMVPDVDAVVVEYATSQSGVSLELHPLVAFRGYHELTHANSDFNAALETGEGCVSLRPYAGLPRLWFRHNGAQLGEAGQWYFHFEYPIERERGFEFHEDLFCPFVLTWALEPGKPAVLSASTQEHFDEGPRSSSSPFVITSGGKRTIVAGYPWFTDWGRDTMIALPGLTLTAGRYDDARDILRTWAAHVDQGMLPNRLPDEFNSTGELNSVDASLWFFEAVRLYIAATGDSEFVRRELLDKLREIVDWHVRGTRFGIHMDTDGLLIAGDAQTQLTWMDARSAGVPVTPRGGKPVEVEALWFNALSVLNELTGGSYSELAARAGTALADAFWNPAAGCLYDVIDGSNKDASLRPNQVIALSLGYCAIAPDRARSILRVVEKELLTPYGLRTLAPSDPRYCGIYEGPAEHRDAVYHQGTVWPWLMGPYVAAQKRFNGNVGDVLEPLLSYMRDRGLGQIPEIFDGDAPHHPRGCFAQAWSVAEVLRAERL
jgi:glycogen debranching enzyme